MPVPGQNVQLSMHFVPVTHSDTDEGGPPSEEKTFMNGMAAIMGSGTV
jgi:hypothetical protein